MGRKVLGILMLLVVLSVFCKVPFLGEKVNRKSIENGQLILQRFKKDWASAQRVVSESDPASSIPKRILERLPVSFSHNDFNFNFNFSFLFWDQNQILCFFFLYVMRIFFFFF